MKRIKALQFLCFISFLIPNKSFIKTRSLNKQISHSWTVANIIVLCTTIFHCYSEFGQALNKPNVLPKKERLLQGNVDTNVEINSVESLNSTIIHAQIPPPDESESVVQLSNVLPHLISYSISLALRLGTWICFSFFHELKSAFQLFYPNPNELDICIREYIALGLIISSLVPRHFELWCDNNRFDIPGLSNNSIWQQIFSHVKCFIGESFSILTAGVALISLSLTITSSIAKQDKSLDEKAYTHIWNTKTIQKFRGPSLNAFRLGFHEIQPTILTSISHCPPFQRLISIENDYISCVNLWNKLKNKTAFVTLLLFLELTLSLSFKSFLAVSRFLKAEKTENITVNAMFYEAEMDWRTINAVISTIINLSFCFSVTNSVHILHTTVQKFQLKLLRMEWSKNLIPVTLSIRNNFVADQHISYLLHIVEQDSINLTAFGYFNVRRSTLISLAGVIVTYLIVLIQFQTS